MFIRKKTLSHVIDCARKAGKTSANLYIKALFNHIEVLEKELIHYMDKSVDNASYVVKLVCGSSPKDAFTSEDMALADCAELIRCTVEEKDMCLDCVFTIEVH